MTRTLASATCSPMAARTAMGPPRLEPTTEKVCVVASAGMVTTDGSVGATTGSALMASSTAVGAASSSVIVNNWLCP